MRYFFSLVLFSITLASPAQRILNVNLFMTNNGVVVNFVIAGGTYCDGYTILRSLDSLNYSIIGQNSTDRCNGTANEEKNYTDEGAVLNAVNYYKVRLETNVETSYPRSIYVSKNGNSSMFVYPNPVYEGIAMTRLRLLGAGNSHVVGYLFNTTGAPLREIDLTTEAESVNFDTYGLTNGLYIIWLTDGSRVYSCRFIVYR